MPNYVLGMNAKLYFSNTALTNTNTNAVSGASWTEMTNVKDVTVNMETGEADVTTRANSGWRATAATLREMTIEFEMQWKTTDAGFTAVKSFFLNSGEIALAAMDGAINTTNNQGPAGNFTITNFSREEPLEDAVKVKVTAKSSSMQQWYTAA